MKNLFHDRYKTKHELKFSEQTTVKSFVAVNNLC